MNTNRFVDYKLELSIILFCGFQARDLVRAWLHAPFEEAMFFVFMVWLIPLIFFLTQNRSSNFFSYPFLFFALLLSVLHTLSALHILGHLALVFSLSSVVFRSFPCAATIWLSASLCWMPASGFLLKYVPIFISFGLRFTVVVLATAILTVVVKNKRELA